MQKHDKILVFTFFFNLTFSYMFVSKVTNIIKYPLYKNRKYIKITKTLLKNISPITTVKTF